jgi:hypothetical protein
MTDKTGRNDPCPCGSGRKFKHCHGPQGGWVAPESGSDARTTAPGIALEWLRRRYARALEAAFDTLLFDEL